MGDKFYEQFISRKPGPFDGLAKVGLILLTVLLLILGLFGNPILLGLFVVAGIACYFLFPRFKKEYEYSYVNGDLDIAVIYSKQSRKSLDSIAFADIECVAPEGSHELDSYGQSYAVKDYTSGNAEDKVYVIVTGGQDKTKYRLNIDEEILKDLKYRIPRKVFEY